MRRMRWIMGLLLVPMLAIVAHGQPAHAQSDDLKIQITQVDGSQFPLVTLYISITDQAGQPAVGLTEGEIKVAEDGQQVEIVEFKGSGGAPVSTLLILDRSGSMQGDKIIGAQQAASTFVNLMRSEDKTGLLLFAGTHELSQPLTSDKQRLEQAISAIQLDADTALYDAVIAGTQRLIPVQGRKSAVVLSDGRDNRDELQGFGAWMGAGSTHTLEEAVSQATVSGVTLYTIGLGERLDLNEDALKQLAAQTGGIYFYAPSADELGELYRSLSQQFQTEYTVTYRSPRAAYDGTRRGIEVNVDANGGLTGSGGHTYLEQHLLQVRSTTSAAMVLLSALLFALIGPLLIAPRRTPRRVAVPLAAGGPPIEPLVSSPAPPPAARSCHACGASIREGARFCNGCGTRQE